MLAASSSTIKWPSGCLDRRRKPMGKDDNQVYGNTLKEIKIAGIFKNNHRIQVSYPAKLL
jgi:hypothetical protein